MAIEEEFPPVYAMGVKADIHHVLYEPFGGIGVVLDYT
jgi:hypothetical protein